MVVAVQRLLDDAAEVNPDQSVRLLEATVLAAELSSEAAAAARDGELDPAGTVLTRLRNQCEQIASDYGGAVRSAEWTQVPMADATAAWTCRLTARSA